jgi:HipA-like protein
MDYRGNGISLTLPTTKSTYDFKCFPPFFEGLDPVQFFKHALAGKISDDSQRAAKALGPFVKS